MTSIQNNVFQTEGDYICKSGVQTGYDCGFIINDDLTYTLDDDNILVWGKQVDEQIIKGDSGGPVFINYAALGFMSGIFPNVGFSYATTENAQDALDVRICIDYNCS